MYMYAALFKDTITTKYTKLSEIRNCFSIVPFTIKIYYILFKETSMCKKKPTTENTLCSSLNTQFIFRWTSLTEGLDQQISHLFVGPHIKCVGHVLRDGAEEGVVPVVQLMAGLQNRKKSIEGKFMHVFCRKQR